MRTRKLSRLTQTAIGPKTVEFENIVQQALISTVLKITQPDLKSWGMIIVFSMIPLLSGQLYKSINLRSEK